jgi:hypothetical protein
MNAAAKSGLVAGGALFAFGVGLGLANGCRSVGAGGSGAGGGVPTDARASVGAADPRAGWTTAVEPKPLSDVAQRGLDWLVRHQNDDGGFGQGEESSQMHGGQGGELDRSNVGDTCIAALALVRSGSTPAAGPHAEALARAAGYVCSEVEAADAESLYVTSVRGTRIQAKIGTYADTFLASLFLAEIKGRMGTDARDERVDAALAKVLDKIARNQNQNGGWDGQGWATVLSQSIGGKGLNRAAQVGAQFDAQVLEKLGSLSYAGAGDAVPASAGVELYAVAGTAGNAQDFVNSGFVRERELRDRLEQTSDADQRKDLEEELKDLEDDRAKLGEQQSGLVGRLSDQGFVSGFGSNGGEEFLSYMNISESLVVRADELWRKWDDGMAQNLGRVQNQDGSWSGHHCITGRTFCTASALLVLMADRAPVPVEVVAARK